MEEKNQLSNELERTKKKLEETEANKARISRELSSIQRQQKSQAMRCGFTNFFTNPSLFLSLFLPCTLHPKKPGGMHQRGAENAVRS